MSFMQAFPAALDGILLRLALPVWLISFTKQGRQALRGYTEMEVSHPNTLHQLHKLKHWPQNYMVEMIEDRKTSAGLEGRRDILSNLIRASLETTVPQKDFEFTHRDLLGNIFVFLFAGKMFGFRYYTPTLPLNCSRGHETTANVLSFSIALLATHQEEQEELYRHVRSVVPDGRLPVRRGRSIFPCSHYPIRPIKTCRNSV